MVRAAELGASGGEATTGSDVGQSGADSGGSVHLCMSSEFAVITAASMAVQLAYLELHKGDG